MKDLDFDTLALFLLFGMVVGLFALYESSGFFGAIVALPLLILCLVGFILFLLAKAGAADALAGVIAAPAGVIKAVR